MMVIPTTPVRMMSESTGARRPLVFLTLVMSLGCGGNPVAPDPTSSMPEWLTALIRQSEAQPVANPPAFVAQYDYKGQSVYFLPQAAATS